MEQWVSFEESTLVASDKMVISGLCGMAKCEDLNGSDECMKQPFCSWYEPDSQIYHDAISTCLNCGKFDSEKDCMAFSFPNPCIWEYDSFDTETFGGYLQIGINFLRYHDIV